MEPGSGKVYVETIPLTGIDFQETARIAVNVASEQAHVNPNEYDFKFTVIVPQDVYVVDGPSAGLPLTVAVYSAMVKKPADMSVYATGTIASNGSVGRVGGVYYKALAAAQDGAKTLLVPSSETFVSIPAGSPGAGVGAVNLQDLLTKEGYNVHVVGVSNVSEALPYYFT